MKKFTVFVSVFLTLTIAFVTFAPLITTAESISDKVLRLHILANSDSTADQSIKLGLRDYFLQKTSEIFDGTTIEENIEIAKKNQEYIESICNEYLEQYNQSAEVEITQEYFKTRVYDDFIMPAGYYNCVRIKIGEGTGHNWWCIIFPSVCLSSCSSSMYDYMTEEEMELINSGFTPKFKIIEIYEKLKSRQ